MKQKMKKPTTVSIDKDYLATVPRPTDEQYEALKKSIKKDGLLNPIIVNKDGKVLDGHTRFEICSELNIIPEYEVKSFDNINDEKLYVLTSNLKRRHLDDFQIVELTQNELSEIREEQKRKNYQFKENSKDPDYIPRKDMTRDQRSPFKDVAGKIGVKPVKIEHCLRILNTENQKLISDVREKRMSVTQALKQLEKKNSKKRRYDFGNKKIPSNKVMKFCPVCGTKTLESFYNVVEIHCAKCDYYYSIKRRKH